MISNDSAANKITEQILKYIDLCKRDFDTVWNEEGYKWEALKHYKDNWDIDADDFASMYAEAFRPAASGEGALLAGGMYLPYGTICDMASEDPESIRGMFRTLFDEGFPLATRYSRFREEAERCLAEYRNRAAGREKKKNHYQDLRAVSVYLAFEYPGKYFLYKFNMYKQFRDKVGFEEIKGKNKSVIWKLDNYMRLCDEVLDLVRCDDELTGLLKRHADGLDVLDPEYHLLTQTVIYYGSWIDDDVPATVPSYQESVPDETSLNETCAAEEVFSGTDIDKNTILYGPPGTGKTYNAVFYAVAIVEDKPLEQVQSESYGEVVARYKEYRDKGYISFCTFHQSYAYEDFIEGIRPVMDAKDCGNAVTYTIKPGVFKAFCDAIPKGKRTSGGKNYVFIIDEINRGNISNIFGELITLIEESKRLGSPEETTAVLPYSGEPFGIPRNLYLIGTMNTADRSIASLDTALRRRFHFREMLPDPHVLSGINVEDISIENMLKRLNYKISVLYDREHVIGHAYFIKLRDDPSIEMLGAIFENSIIPLLQDYFYNDYEKIRLVLGDNAKEAEDEQFIIARDVDTAGLFGNTDFELDDGVVYEINTAAFDNIESYRSI